ncbi:MAG: TetR/AcrR family transcriptional regulator [Kiritimatiellia bacterium]|nr:TetR/AcrR family transcriptional regulator [Kiritimatiellia bacterium]
MGRYNSGQKRAILEAAVVVFAANGLDGATIRRVGRKAGVNSALIYYYFENKQKLFDEVIRMVFSDFLLMLGRNQPPFENARARITFLVHGIFDYYETRRERMRLMICVFNLHIHMLADIILDVLKQKQVLPLAVLQDGILRKEFRPFSPLQLWWNLLGMCIFTIQAQEIAVMLNQKKIAWDLTTLHELIKLIVELLLSGLAFPQQQLKTKQEQ